MDYLASVRRDGAALSAAARSAPDVPVPSCPEWDMRQLVAHTGAIHRWVTGMVRTRATEVGPFPEAPVDGDLMAWFDTGVDELLSALGGIGPDEPLWNWAARKAAPASFWPRRMAHETAMHRWDAQHAASQADPIDAVLARDGIDEYLGFVDMWLRRRPVEALGGSLGLAVDRPCTIVLHPDHIEIVAGLDQADTVLEGSASDALLFLAGRVPPEAGDQSVLATWSESIAFS